jgi:aspartate/methionine/tyrosine aminotransferase
MRDPDGARDGWTIAADLAATGLLVAPGDIYGPAGAGHVRVALTVTDDQLALACRRLAASTSARAGASAR